MSHRPLVFVFGLTLGDYLLWSWSLNGSHDVLALISGLTLPPLAVACLWLLALSVIRLIARTARRPPGRLRRRSPARSRPLWRRSIVTAPLEPVQDAAAPTDAPSRKIAA